MTQCYVEEILSSLNLSKLHSSTPIVSGINELFCIHKHNNVLLVNDADEV